jgi:hypothetical protein
MDHHVLDREPFCRRAAWAWLIENAAFSETEIGTGGKRVKLQRGQLSYSVRFLATAWKWDKAKVSRFCLALSNDDMIRVQTETGQMLITICNYEQYQETRDTTRDATETAARQQRDSSETKKKEDKQDNNLSMVDSAPEKPLSKPKPDEAFERFWKAYPSRGESSNPKKPCQAKFASAVKSGVDPEVIIRGAARYAETMARETNRALVAQAQTFLSQARWEQFAQMAAASPPADPVRDQWRDRLAGFREQGFWLSSWGAKPGDPYCNAPADLLAQTINQKEHAA